MRSFLLLGALFYFSVAAANIALAQSTFDAFMKEDAEAEAKQGVTEEELAKFEQVLNGDDEDRALRAMRFMLQSGNPKFVRRAKEFGLYSADPLFRHEALKAVFDDGGPFRLVADLSVVPEEESRMRAYIARLGGSISADGTEGYVTFSVDGYDPEKKCWIFPGRDKNCAFVLANTSVSLSGWHVGSGNLTLDNNAVLSGSLEYTMNGPFRPVPAKIVLIE